MDGIFVIKNVSVKLFSFFNGGCIGDQLLQWNVSVKPSCVYRWSRTCLSTSSAFMEGSIRDKNVSDQNSSVLTSRVCLNEGYIHDQERVCQTLFSGGSICDQERVCQTLQLHLWRCIGDQERVSQTLQLPQWRVYWWSRTCLSNSSASSMEGVLVIKNVSVKPFSFSNGVCTGDQERVCQSRQLL